MEPLEPPSSPERVGTWNRMEIGSLEHFRWLELIVRFIFVLNLLDAVLTMLWVYSGKATEANPVMGAVLSQHPILFVLTKLTLVGLGSALLWRHRRQPLAVVAILGVFMVYYVLLLYHLSSLNLRLLSYLF